MGGFELIRYHRLEAHGGLGVHTYPQREHEELHNPAMLVEIYHLLPSSCPWDETPLGNLHH